MGESLNLLEGEVYFEDMTHEHAPQPTPNDEIPPSSEVDSAEKERRYLLELSSFASSLGLVETERMKQIREQLKKMSLGEEPDEWVFLNDEDVKGVMDFEDTVDGLIAEYQESAIAEMQKTNPDFITGAKQQIALSVTMALLYCEQGMWDEAGDYLDTADSYAQNACEFSEEANAQMTPIWQTLQEL